MEEPRVRTPAEAVAEVARQKAEGYDLLKTHQVMTPDDEDYATTVWMDRPTYMALHEAARAARFRVLGHGPYFLGLQAALDAHHNLAHLNELNPLYFMPVRNSSPATTAFLGGFGVLLLVLAAAGISGLLRRFRRESAAVPSKAVRRVAIWNLALVVLSVAGLFLFLLVMPGGIACGSIPLLLLYSALASLPGLGTLDLLRQAFQIFRDPKEALAARIRVACCFLGTLILALSIIYWLPVPWRCTDRAIQNLARRCRESGIWIQSTLTCQQIGLGGRQGFRPEDVFADPFFKALDPGLQKRWRESPFMVPGWIAALMRNYPAFTRKVLGALGREGVPIMAGTDTGGLPMVIPGSSLHGELGLLEASGMDRQQVLWSATVGPAAFLGRENEAGTVGVGKRADLILVRGNPLEDLACLRRPIGIVLRGRWLPREELDRMVALLEK